MNPTAEKPLDIDDLKRLRRMGRKMVSLYADIDPKFQKASSHLSISCKAGCSGCCYLMVLVSLPEAIAIAEYFLEDHQRRQMIPLLMRSFLEQVQQTPSGPVAEVRENYFAKKVPCTFLDTETKLCTIYPVRPAACRYHAVVSDPALCQPEAGKQSVLRLNTQAADNAVLLEANKVSNQTKVGLFVAPLPVMMMWAFKLLIEGRAAFETALKDETEGPLSLSVWAGVLAGMQEADRARVPPAQPPTQPDETPAARSD